MTQDTFLNMALQAKALRFGKFVLKSGRTSPYFFNTGVFNSGQKLHELAICYARTIIERDLNFDVLFGPAYKGIVLANIVAEKLYTLHRKNVGVCYNRKEKKNHGEKGLLVGSCIQNKRVLIIDDVITAGTALKEAITLVKNSKPSSIIGAIIALDREEKAPNSQCSVTQAIRDNYGVPLFSITSLSVLINFMKKNGNFSSAEIEKMDRYQLYYGLKQKNRSTINII